MKVKEILKLNNVIKQMLDNQNFKLGVKPKFKLLTVMKQIEPVVANFETIRNEKIMEYGSATEDGDFSIDPKSENYAKFVADMEELAGSDSSIQIQKVKASELFDEGLPTEYLLALFEIIEED